MMRFEQGLPYADNDLMMMLCESFPDDDHMNNDVYGTAQGALQGGDGDGDSDGGDGWEQKNTCGLERGKERSKEQVPMRITTDFDKSMDEDSTAHITKHWSGRERCVVVDSAVALAAASPDGLMPLLHVLSAQQPPPQAQPQAQRTQVTAAVGVSPGEIVERLSESAEWKHNGNDNNSEVDDCPHAELPASPASSHTSWSVSSAGSDYTAPPLPPPPSAPLLRAAAFPGLSCSSASSSDRHHHHHNNNNTNNNRMTTSTSTVPFRLPAPVPPAAPASAIPFSTSTNPPATTTTTVITPVAAVVERSNKTKSCLTVPIRPSSSSLSPSPSPSPSPPPPPPGTTTTTTTTTSISGKKQRQKRRYAAPKASRYCHVCARHERTVSLVACSNVFRNTCQKSVCVRCISEYALQAERAPWICPHCRDACPKRAKCFSYDRQTQRRRERSLSQKQKPATTTMPPSGVVRPLAERSFNQVGSGSSSGSGSGSGSGCGSGQLQNEIRHAHSQALLSSCPLLAASPTVTGTGTTTPTPTPICTQNTQVHTRPSSSRAFSSTRVGRTCHTSTTCSSPINKLKLKAAHTRTIRDAAIVTAAPTITTTTTTTTAPPAPAPAPAAGGSIGIFQDIGSIRAAIPQQYSFPDFTALLAANNAGCSQAFYE